MRKTIATALAVALGAVGMMTAPTSYADGMPTVPTRTAPTESSEPPLDTLRTARRVLEGDATGEDPSATVALRDLWLSRGTLRGQARRQADAMLARPTDGALDPVGFGYPNPSLATNVCNARLCVHYVPSGDDAPASIDWVNHTLATMDQVWTAQVDQMGFRPPIGDRGAGGTAQFDVYLKDLGGQLYGFCAPEKRGRKGRTASGYCVLDNSFGPDKFTGTPDGNLRVTAAHEFFHAVQYAYDFREDLWMMESTATWIEERFASEVDDNRQYLPASQLYTPGQPLDTFQQGHAVQYGNWIFWEYLSHRYGPNIVKRAWTAAGQLKRNGGRYSFQALNKVLRKKGGLSRNYAQFAADNLVPHLTYPEGAAYPAPAPRRNRVLTRKRRSVGFGTRIHHMASASYRVRPAAGLSGRRWKLRVRVSGPARRTKPFAVVLVHRADGRVSRRMVRLNRRGNGSIRVPFSSSRVAAVSVTLVNASTRMQCKRRTLLACSGKPRDNGRRFRFTARAVKR